MGVFKLTDAAHKNLGKKIFIASTTLTAVHEHALESCCGLAQGRGWQPNALDGLGGARHGLWRNGKEGGGWDKHKNQDGKHPTRVMICVSLTLKSAASRPHMTPWKPPMEEESTPWNALWPLQGGE